MKTILISLFTLFAFISQAQITKISITASGLTCSMCSKAIYKALLKIPAVEKVDADIERSGYDIAFRPGAKIILSEFKKAVQDAGFSLASFVVKANFSNEDVNADQRVTISGNEIYFVGIQKQTLTGIKTLQVVDKGYLSEKDRHKYQQTGRHNTTSEPADNIYHVILQQS